jgi:predicted Zn-dependent protease
MGSVSPEQIRSEQVKQQQLVVESQIQQQTRLDDVALTLLQAGVPLCGSAVTTRTGFRFTSRSYFNDEYLPAAIAMGLTDTVVVTSVARGSGAERAGLRAGDRIISVDGRGVIPDEGAVPTIDKRDSILHAMNIPADTVCAYDVAVLKSAELNAFADGKTVYVTSQMLRFAADDDELATVVGHEIAHNAMGHNNAMKANAAMGAILGLVVDIAMARQGVNTGGRYTNDFAALGAMVYSQDFEREADYVGLYILAGANRPIANAPNLWRRIAQESPSEIKFASSHPTTAERFVRLDQWRAEIQSKVALGAPLRPEMKNGLSAPVTQLARAADHAPPTTTKTTTAGTQRAQTPQPSALATKVSPAAADPAKSTPAKVPRSDDRMAVAIVGAPASESDRVAGSKMFELGLLYLGRQDWAQAEDAFKKSVRLDGSVAACHAKLGEVEMVLGHWEEAEAEYTAASLIDVDNQEYRARIKEARSRKS